MTPSIGRIVHFEVDEHTAEHISAFGGNNRVVAGELVAAVIVRVWNPTCVNLKLILDGQQDLWVTSVAQGTGPRTFCEPARV